MSSPRDETQVPEVPAAPAVPAEIEAQVEAEATLEIDETIGSSSDFEEDSESLNTSISSSIRAYRIENGRRYHAFKDGSYIFPNDERENDRLDLQHAVFLKSLDDKLYLAPLREDVQNVLDIGTGTGLWAMDFADQFPSATVVGTDLSPIQPTWIPPNLNFIIDDCEDEWIYDRKFDYIHARMMCGSLKDWPHFMEQSYKNMAPGGWLEFQDIDMPFSSDDDSLNEDTALWRWSNNLVRAGEILGRPLNAAHQYKKWMEEAGFVDVQEIMIKWPQNPWPKQSKYKEIGLWTMQNLLQGLHGLSMRPMVGALGMSPEEVEVLMSYVRRDIRNPRIRAYWRIYFVWGRKAENAVS